MVAIDKKVVILMLDGVDGGRSIFARSVVGMVEKLTKLRKGSSTKGVREQHACAVPNHERAVSKRA